MKQTLSREFGFFSLIQFALPTIVMMIFLSLYTIVDGIFVSRFVGTDALSAVNIVYPFSSVILAVSLMFATGGSAVIARQLGEGNDAKARSNFSAVVLVALATGCVLAVSGLAFLTPLCRALGADGALLPLCEDYLRILLYFTPAYVLQTLYQCYFVAAGKPGIGLTSTILAGVVNAVLDYVMIVPLGMGIAGAALATGIGYTIPAIWGTVYFLRRRGTLYYAKPVFHARVLRETCFNGSSEMVTSLSASVITFLFNMVMLRILGPDGVASITIVLYAQFLMTALYMGFSMGVAPVISFNYGSGNTARIRRIFICCMSFILLSSVLVFACSKVFAAPISAVFAPRDSTVYALTVHGFGLFTISFLFAGLNIFASALFTALSNGIASAALSFLRTFVFIVLGLLLLPIVLDVDGVWLAVPLAEALTLLFSIAFLLWGRKRYHYI